MIDHSLLLEAGAQPVQDTSDSRTLARNSEGDSATDIYSGSQQGKQEGPGFSERASKRIQGVSTDTRTVQPGQLFVCLKGPNFDAHDFVDVAVKAGAVALMVERSSAAAAQEKLNQAGLSCPLYVVDNTLEGLQRLASVYRRKQNYTVYGITGSNGKTSAKEMLLGMLGFLAGSERVDATRGNLNNHIGVPLTILNLKPGIQHAIIEMGMNHGGEILELSRIARPDHGLITSIGRAHIEFFYSKRGIARAKQELVQNCRATLAYPVHGIGKSLLLRRDPSALEPAIHLFGMQNDPFWRAVPAAVQKSGLWKEVRGRDLQCSPGGLDFRIVERSEELQIRNSHYFSRVQAENLLGCLTVLLAAGFPAQDVVRSAQHAAPISGGRFHIYEGEGRILVDDTYNANPDSFLAAIQALHSMRPGGRLLALAGAMAELGDNAERGHAEVGRSLHALGFDVLACGAAVASAYLTQSDEPESSAGREGFFFPDSEQLADYIERHPRDFLQYDGILAKGSRSSRMERACDALKRIGYV
ncbi:MAG: UDP-N-acetylmuramoyl-tripeptide--D-alanyl-D-alanine ligase [Leptospiraceae bacterium]|nr:UDP-N-acetylmuramoyl-tripeptide--D-alanyl-D-alanine ligase [Leptospiraceae bacterium]